MQVAPSLFVGDVNDAFDRTELTKVGVTHILNVASELNFSERVGFEYAKIAIDDDCHTCDMCKILPKTIEFIHEATRSGGKVMVHCLEGKSKSVCVALAYMIIHEGWDSEILQFLTHHHHIYPLYLQQTLAYCLGKKPIQSRF
jgi:protein-tyrosine phosphatase